MASCKLKPCTYSLAGAAAQPAAMPHRAAGAAAATAAAATAWRGAMAARWLRRLLLRRLRVEMGAGPPPAPPAEAAGARAHSCEGHDDVLSWGQATRDFRHVENEV